MNRLKSINKEFCVLFVKETQEGSLEVLAFLTGNDSFGAPFLLEALKLVEAVDDLSMTELLRRYKDFFLLFGLVWTVRQA